MGTSGCETGGGRRLPVTLLLSSDEGVSLESRGNDGDRRPSTCLLRGRGLVGGEGTVASTVVIVGRPRGRRVIRSEDGVT